MKRKSPAEDGNGLQPNGEAPSTHEPAKASAKTSTGNTKDQGKIKSRSKSKSGSKDKSSSSKKDKSATTTMTSTAIDNSSSGITTTTAKTLITPPSLSSSTYVSDPSSIPLSSPYSLVTSVRYLSISPAYSANPSLGVQLDHLDPMVFKHDPTLGGVILAHQNLRFLSETARLMNESPFAFAWCAVEFLLWKPRKGMVLEGWVNNASPSHVGMLFANIFSISVGAKGGEDGRIPAGWSWVDAKDEILEEELEGEDEEEEEEEEEEEDATAGAEGEGKGAGGEGDKKEKKAFWHEKTKKIRTTGYWRDASGNRVEGNQRFQVTAVKTDGAMVSLEGTFLIKRELIPRIIDTEEPSGHGQDENGKKKKRKKRKEVD